jgi:long-chain acyl-CoA synthetase
MNVADFLLERGQDGHVALVVDSNEYTFLDLKRAAAGMAREILQAGARPGDAIGLLATNSLFWIAVYLAAIKLGCVAVPLNPASLPAELLAVAEFTGCRVMCVQRRLARRFAEGLPSHLHLIFDEVLNVSSQDRGLWDSLTQPVSDAQDAALLLTSGTTASPRAVRLTHKNIQANTTSIIASLGLTGSERMLAALPFHYCFGTSLLHTHLRVGGSLVLCNSFVYPESVLNLLEAQGCTGFAGVPSMYQTLIRNSTLPKRQFPHLRKVQQAGGKLSPVLIQELVAMLPQAQIFIMYGQTEATARLSCLPPELLPTKLGSVGRGIPGVELRVVDESGNDAPPGEIGEIVARGDNISPGYLNNPEATAERFVGGTLRTGDLAKVDADGFITIVDRKSDFIKSFGHRVSSQQIEEETLKLPDVAAAAAVGVPDPDRGEAIVVHVVIRTGSPLLREEILVHCKKHLPRHMWPREIVVVDSLPVNAQGKVLKSVLRDQAVQSTPATGRLEGQP